MELVTFSDLKALLGLEGDLITDYPALGVIKSSVEDAIETYLGLQFGEKSRTVVFYPANETRFFDLKALPIDSISAVTVDDVELVYADDEYKRRDSGITLPFATDKTVSITYTGGYSVETLPAVIKRAALYQSAYEFQRKTVIGATSVGTDQCTTKTPGLVLLESVTDILDFYKHPDRIS